MVKILVPGLNSQPITLILTNVKYCLVIGPFNLISMS
jgi:hypothetical protein